MEATEPLASLLDQLTTRLERVEAQMGLANTQPAAPAKTTSTPAPQEEGELSPQMEAYDEYVSQCLPRFLDACASLGDEAKVLGDVTKRAFDAQRSYLLMASRCTKPASPNPDHLKALQSCLKELNDMRDNRSDFANHQNMVNEGVQALGWLLVEPAPKPFIESYLGGSDFWGNKIRVQHKASNPAQIEFVESFRNLLVQLMAYVKEHHTTGVTWNPNGQDVASYAPPQSTPATPPAKKTSPPPAKSSAASKLAGAKPKKEPTCEQRNGNWNIEYQWNLSQPMVLSDITLKQQVYIFNCQDAAIILEGKAKNIVLDTCSNVKLLFDDAVSSLEIVNCKKVQVQCKGTVPSVAIDKTDGCLIFLAWEGRTTQFVTSKSSEMNVMMPDGPGSEEVIERPLPEQFVHKLTDALDVTSEVSDLYS